MKNKYLFLFVLFSSFAFSDVLYVKQKKCIHDDYYFSNGKFNYIYSSDSVASSTKKFKATDLEYGYEYVDKKCQKVQVLQYTKMTYHDYKFMTALTGMLLGLVVFIVTIFIFIKKD